MVYHGILEERDKLGLSSDASELEIKRASAEQARNRELEELGLPPDASIEEINSAMAAKIAAEETEEQQGPQIPKAS